MKFSSIQIRGKGRGKMLGFPTINLRIPEKLDLKQGVYAVWVTINEKKYLGALYFGPIPTFGEKGLSLEVYIIDDNFKDTGHEIEVETLKYIRPVKEFDSSTVLVEQIKKDIDIISGYAN